METTGSAATEFAHTSMRDLAIHGDDLIVATHAVVLDS